MAGGWRRGAARSRLLRILIRDTMRALRDLKDILNFDPEISTTVQQIGLLSSRPTALVLLGTSPTARVRLLHCLLGRRLLPEPLPRGCRWLRIQYGATTQVHLTVGNSGFELVEDLECNKRPWETLPLQDLLRRDHTDLSTIIDVELNISLLKDGLRIIIPPDIESDPQVNDCHKIKEKYSELYSKRMAIVRSFTPIYLYAIDKMGGNVFSECAINTSTSTVEEDFWNTYNMYYMARGKTDNDSGVKEKVTDDSGERQECRPSVISGENCLDLHQVKEMDPYAQFYFILFSDTTPGVKSEEGSSFAGTESTEVADPHLAAEISESDPDIEQQRIGSAQGSSEHTKKSNRKYYEEQVTFMNDLLDQWELMSKPPAKHHVKSQWMILDDVEVMEMEEKGLAEGVNSETHAKTKWEADSDWCMKSRVLFLNTVLKFSTQTFQTHILEQCTRLSEVHVKLLQQFILVSFDMARELQVIPKKVQFVARQEQQLYESMTEMFTEGNKKQELIQIMQEVLQDMRTEVDNMDWSVDDLPCHQDKRFMTSTSMYYSQVNSPTGSLQMNENNPIDQKDQSNDQIGQSDGKEGAEPDGDGIDCVKESECDVEEAVAYSYNFDDYEMIACNNESLCASECYSQLCSPSDDVFPTSQIDMIPVENERESMSRALSFSQSGWPSPSSTTSATVCTNTSNISLKHASLDVQQTVLSKLSRTISLKLVKFVDCLKDAYFGTLQRCLESLERSCQVELATPGCSAAAQQLMRATRCVELRALASFSLLSTLLDSLRRFLQRLHIMGGDAEDACCVLSPVWRRQVALHTVQSLSPQRLARIISKQIIEKLSDAHEKYQSALGTLENVLANRLHHTEDVKLAIRKKYAPSFARLCLDSTSMCDLLMYGTPELGQEIGRGQYGVVYAVRGAWAGHSPAAVKSVLPADERHYCELAMEFFYTRSIPSHPRIVRLLGSLVQRGGGGAAPGVLLVSPRYCRDLHAAVRAGLTFAARMRISCDIVEGIRYLHSLGLVHRDVKMKNVLLDSQDRAALSDLGFCAAEALISGSIVGTPVHMAPELFGGDYDAAVDIYAFGILFWYVCAGNIKQPAAFETCLCKEQLWSKVRRGLRPERLPHFTDECWEIMEACWASDPSQRALLGDVQLKLEGILEKVLNEDPKEPYVPVNRPYEGFDDDTLDITGFYKIS